jgi:carboxypeptidase C (cathepsin A)
MAQYLYQSTDIEIAGIAIGNGWVDPFYQFPAYGEFAHANGLIHEGTAVVLKFAYKLCQYSLVLEIPIVSGNLCMMLGIAISTPGYSEFNVYDIREPCVELGLCYPDNHIADYFNSDLYRDKFNITTPIAWEECAPMPHLALTLDHNKMAGYKLS